MSFIPKNVRSVLNAYSQELFGVSSKWQKLMTHPSYRVVTNQITTEKPKYVYYTDAKSGAKTVVKLDTAIANGYDLPDLSAGGVEYEWRSPTAEEMISVLLKMRFDVAERYLPDDDLQDLLSVYALASSAMYNNTMILCADQAELDAVNQILGSTGVNKVSMTEDPGKLAIPGAKFLKVHSEVKDLTLEELAKAIDLLLQRGAICKIKAMIEASKQPISSSYPGGTHHV